MTAPTPLEFLLANRSRLREQLRDVRALRAECLERFGRAPDLGHEFEALEGALDEIEAAVKRAAVPS